MRADRDGDHRLPARPGDIEAAHAFRGRRRRDRVPGAVLRAALDGPVTDPDVLTAGGGQPELAVRAGPDAGDLYLHLGPGRLRAVVDGGGDVRGPVIAMSQVRLLRRRRRAVRMRH